MTIVCDTGIEEKKERERREKKKKDSVCCVLHRRRRRRRRNETLRATIDCAKIPFFHVKKEREAKLKVL